MLRRIFVAGLLLLGSGASAAVHESARTVEESALLDYVAVAGCVQTVVLVQAVQQVVTAPGGPLRASTAIVIIEIRDTCTGTDLLVVNHAIVDPDSDQRGIISASLVDEFTTDDGHDVAIDVLWTAGDTTGRRLERLDFEFPGERMHVSAREIRSDAVIAGVLVIDGVTTGLSAAAGSLRRLTLQRTRVAR